MKSGEYSVNSFPKHYALIVTKASVQRVNSSFLILHTTLYNRSEVYLNFVEVLSSLKRHDIVGRDSNDGFVCGVFGRVEC